MTDSSSAAFRQTVDQLVEVGFEMIMYSFGRFVPRFLMCLPSFKLFF
jgi:hypothetical protein